MAKQRNTYAKRNREMEKKQKADEKRARRKVRAARNAQPMPSDNAGTAHQAAGDL
jgi:hypothetical protein